MKISKLIRTCTACPSSWEGKTDDNRDVYIRFRWGDLSVRLGEPGIDYLSNNSKKTIFDMSAVLGEQISDPLDGLLEYYELQSLLSRKLGWELPEKEEPAKEISDEFRRLETEEE